MTPYSIIPPPSITNTIEIGTALLPKAVTILAATLNCSTILAYSESDSLISETTSLLCFSALLASGKA
ncbi:hypothetical protein L195_g005767 [Trifolium pratense]|uniref:Uncharacterized protein n=1 Tax=Trifolium pratense TaxID=57577 RepID=A0A2K3P1R2_TRIPR|nr:hypothetical protein L195_g005767 [Trifolium pratense]